HPTGPGPAARQSGTFLMAHAHPDDSLLIEYAAGSLDEATALLVATHLALCPDCRRPVRRAEAVGGALLESAPSEPLASDALGPPTAAPSTRWCSMAAFRTRQAAMAAATSPWPTARCGTGRSPTPTATACASPWSMAGCG